VYLQLDICSLCRSRKLLLLLPSQSCQVLCCLQQQVADVPLGLALVCKSTGSKAQAPAEGALQLLGQLQA
jgi:hypothetical protein